MAPGRPGCSAGSEILFCDKCGLAYRCANFLSVHYADCKESSAISRFSIRAAASAELIVGAGNARVYKSAEFHPSLVGISLTQGTRYMCGEAWLGVAS